MSEPFDVTHDPENIRILLDLSRLGELIAHVALAFTQIREIDPPDFDGQEMKDLSISGWQHVMFMSDRAQFAKSMQADLAKLDVLGSTPEPQHKSEFGL